MLLDTAHAGPVGRVPERGRASRAAGVAARLFLDGLHQPHDARLHAERSWGRNTSPPRASRACRNGASSGATRCATPPCRWSPSSRCPTRGLLEGSVLTETVFAWPGLGLYLTNSLQNADMNAVLGGTLVIGAVFVATQPAFATCSTPLLDPRVRRRDMTERVHPRLAADRRPASRRQARLGQAYRTWLALRRNRLAMVGLAHRRGADRAGDLRRRARPLRPDPGRRSADRAPAAAVAGRI